MIERTLQTALAEAASEAPVVTVTGPRQSGKTTLCRAFFSDHDYVSLEPLDTRAFAQEDPRGFLRQHRGPVILDEVHRVPDLFSYIQEAVDADPTPGRFVLTGSQHFGLSAAISQSLAGRVALLDLLPLGLDEVRRFGSAPSDLWTTVWSGGYPRIYDRGLAPDRWLADYLATYVERDVRQVMNVTDLDAFGTFLKLAAGRTGRELNLSSLGGDAGVSHNTARAWVSVMEASFIVFRLPPWIGNTRKRVIKAPKLHFVDSGLVCHLLGIRSPQQLQAHPLRGAIFESWVAAEVLKARVHRRLPADLFHLRLTRGSEVDLIVETADRIIGVEIKSGATVPRDVAAALETWAAGPTETRTLVRRVVYGGDTSQERTGVEVAPWTAIQDLSWG